MASYDLPEASAALANPALDLRAACRGRDPELWFPDGCGDRSEAVGICHGCPVRHSCLDWGVRTRQSGIWGGELLDAGGPERRLTRARPGGRGVAAKAS